MVCVDFPTRDHEWQTNRPDVYSPRVGNRENALLLRCPPDFVLTRHLGRLHQEPEQKEGKRYDDGPNDSKPDLALRRRTRECHLVVAVGLVLDASGTRTGARVLEKREEESLLVAFNFFAFGRQAEILNDRERLQRGQYGFFRPR